MQRAARVCSVCAPDLVAEQLRNHGVAKPEAYSAHGLRAEALEQTVVPPTPEDGAQLALVPSEVLNLQVMESSNVLDSGEESLAQILGGGGGGGIFSSGCDVLDFGEFRRRE